MSGRTAIVAVKVSPEAKYSLTKFASDHDLHLYQLVELVARIASENPDVLYELIKKSA